jgi:hypothetical protein
MLVMSLLILGIRLLQDIISLLLEVLDLFIEFGFFIYLGVSVGGLYRGRWNGKSCINGGYWLEPLEHLKNVVANRVVDASIIAMLNIWEALITCTWMLGLVHAQGMYNHHVEHLYLSICLGRNES